MSKNKEKHHLPDEIKKDAKEPDQQPAEAETVQEIPAGQEVKPAGAPAKPEPGHPEARKPHKAAEEIERLKDQLLRLRADFENYRKRVLREKGEIYENANEALMFELLPIIDHLQLAINAAKEHKASPAFQDGLQLIADQLMTVLSKYGLDPFVSDKKQFDPNRHEAVAYLPSATEPEGIILAQSRPGYRFKNKILRPAQVVVSSGKPAPPPSETNNQKPAED